MFANLLRRIRRAPARPAVDNRGDPVGMYRIAVSALTGEWGAGTAANGMSMAPSEPSSSHGRIEMNVVDRAKAHATRAHKGQFYGRESYVDAHLAIVAGLVEAHGGDTAHVAVAWLHDEIEDTLVTKEELCSLFGRRIASAVDVLARRVGEPYETYLDRVVSNNDAIFVKAMDSLANLVASIKAANLDPKDQHAKARVEKYSATYSRMHRYLWR